jgi:magnesium-transporting ATPase (P-type)
MKIQYYISSKDEEWMRVKARDRYLLIQLAVQAILFGLAIGVTISGISYGLEDVDVKATSQHPELLVLSLPISLVFVLLYNIEDSLIGLISEHLKNSYKGIENWDSSDLLNKVYSSQGLVYRFFIQVVAFLFIPMLITWRIDLNENPILSFNINTMNWCWVWGVCILTVLIVGLWLRIKSFRRKSAKKDVHRKISKR